MKRLTLEISTLRRLGLAGLLVFATCSLSLAQEFPWHNAANPEDVNADQIVWADDVMPVLNCLHGLSDYCIIDPEDGTVRYNNQLSPPPYLDVSQLGNQAIPLNALRVINKINQTVPRTPPANPITTAQARFKARLAATDVSGNALDTVSTGETFWLKAYVADARPDALGLYSAYLDIAYPAQLVEASGAAEFGPGFVNGQAGDGGTAGLLDNYGAMSDRVFPPSDVGEQLLFTVPLRAIAGGEVTLSLQETASYGLLFGIDPFVTADPSSVQIRVVPEPSSCLLAVPVGLWLMLQGRRRWR